MVSLNSNKTLQIFHIHLLSKAHLLKILGIPILEVSQQNNQFLKGLFYHL